MNSASISRIMEENNYKNCAFCSEKAFYRCSCCVTTPYCSLSCQNKHWLEHKNVCLNICLSKSVSLWKQTISPPVKIFFEVMIQYLQDFNENVAVAWVVETRYLPICYRLLKVKKKSLPTGVEPLKDLKKDMLVMSFHNGTFQRARVCQVYAETQKAIIRLLDTGLSKVESISNLLSPTPEMERTMALAINIMLISNETISLSEGSKIWIQIMGIKAPNGCYHAVQMPKFFGFPFMSTEEKTKIELIQHFDCNKVALCRVMTDKFILPACADNIEILTDCPGEGSFILAMYAKQWHRGRLVGWSDEMNIPHLVYLFDLGKMCFSRALKPLPTTCQETVMRAFLITFNEEDIDATAFLKGDDLSIAVDRKAMETCGIENYAPALPCELYQAGNLLGNVKAHNFTGFLESMNFNYWKEALLDESVVVIKCFVNEKLLAISPAWTSKYRNLFAAMAHQCVSKIGATIEEIDDISLAYNIKDNCYFRAQYVSHIEEDEDEIIKVIDIDSGKFSYVNISQLRELNRFLRSCPVYLTYIELAGVENSKTNSEDSKIYSVLTRYCDDATEFVLKYQGNSNKKAVLNFRSNSKHSLNAEINELLKSEHDILKNSYETTMQSVDENNTFYANQNISSLCDRDKECTNANSNCEKLSLNEISKEFIPNNSFQNENNHIFGNQAKDSANEIVKNILNSPEGKDFTNHENFLSSTRNSTSNEIEKNKSEKKHSFKKYADLIKKVLQNNTTVESFRNKMKDMPGDDEKTTNNHTQEKTNFSTEQCLTESKHNISDKINDTNENMINEPSNIKAPHVQNDFQHNEIEKNQNEKVKTHAGKRINSVFELVRHAETKPIAQEHLQSNEDDQTKLTKFKTNCDVTQMDVSSESKIISYDLRRILLLNSQKDAKPKRFM